MEAIIRMRKRPILFRACKLQMNKLPPSSVQEVMSNDDLLIEILLRLPIASLLVFKFVSKHWLSLITDTVFTQRRSQFKIDPPSGLFLENKEYYDLVSLDLGVKCWLPNMLMPGSIIQQSCNGLLLCSILPDEMYVYNPTINMLKMLPQQHSVIYDRHYNEFMGGTRLAFDPTKSRHYKVVHAGLINREDIQIHIYSSETCTWSDCDDRFPSSSFYRFKDGVYWNGSINWLNNMNGDRLLYFKLDITHHPVLTTTHDLGTMDGKYFRNCNLFESRGSLLFLGMDDYDSPRWASVYEMRNESSGWSIRYVVDFGDDAIFPRSLLWLRYWYSNTVWWIVIEEKEEDSYMVIRFDKRVVKYTMASKTIRVLRYFKPYVPFSPSPQFIASYAHV